MRFISFLSIGILFGIVLYKSEAASWFRIYEMFHFGSFHMFGIIASAIIIGASGLYYIKHKDIKDINGNSINPTPKDFGITRYLVGGIFFGLGWALVGACPGPMYVLIGAGYWPILIVVFGALLGTLLYGVLRSKLPH
jgi:hypothetical protein